MTDTTSRRRWNPARTVAAVVGMVLLAFAALGVTSAPSVAAPGKVHAPIVGSGSSWSSNALEAWIRNVWANYDWKISYSSSGSTVGRNDFANGTSDFGVSEIPYGIANSNEGDPRPARKFAYMPIVAGGTAFMYNLTIGGKRVTNLRLSGETVAKIFTGVITRWDDKAIKKDNPQLALPGIPVVPVVRSDGSGSTAQVSIWLRQQYPALWDAYCPKVGRPMINGHCGVTSTYPVAPGSKFVARANSTGVAGYVGQSHAVGTITYVEYSYALNSGLPVAKILNAAGYYTEPTAHNVAVALLSAQINNNEKSSDYLTQDLRQVYASTDPRTYPLSSYSYIILPTKLEGSFTEDKGLTLADFGAYFLCEGQQSAETMGYSPLPINLVKDGQKQIKKIPGGNPVIKGISDCNNPTFSADGSNKLAKEAPFPQSCDKAGTTQCASGTGGAKNTPTKTSSSSSSGGDGTGSSTGGGGSGNGNSGTGSHTGAGTNSGSGAIAAESGEVLTDPGLVNPNSTGSEPVIVEATPQQIPVQADLGVRNLAMAGAGVGMLAFAVGPSLLGVRSRKPFTRLGSVPKGKRR